MRTTIDIPDTLYVSVRAKLKAEGRTLREVVVDGLQRLMQEEQEQPAFRLRDASFDGACGYSADFQPEDLTQAIHDDADERLL